MHFINGIVMPPYTQNANDTFAIRFVFRLIWGIMLPEYATLNTRTALGRRAHKFNLLTQQKFQLNESISEMKLFAMHLI